MIEFNYSKGRAIDSINFILEEIKEFDKDYSNIKREDYFKDRKKQKLIEKTIENILTALIEICGAIATQEGKEIKSYSNALCFCAKNLVFQKRMKKKFPNWHFKEVALPIDT